MSIFSNSMISQGFRSSLTRNPMQGSMVRQGLQSSETRNPMQNSMVMQGLNDGFGSFKDQFEENTNKSQTSQPNGISNDTLNVLRSVLGAAIDHYRSGLNEGNLSQARQQPYARSFLPTGLFSQER